MIVHAVVKRFFVLLSGLALFVLSIMIVAESGIGISYMVRYSCDIAVAIAIAIFLL